MTILMSLGRTAMYMSVIDTTVVTIHNLFAALWIGSVLFVTYALVPAAREGNVRTATFRGVLEKLTTVTRVSALFLVLSGIYITVDLYTVERLTETTSGYLVIAKVVLWFGLAGVVEAAVGRLRTELNEQQLENAVETVSPLFYVASGLAILSIVAVALLTTGLPF